MYPNHSIFLLRNYKINAEYVVHTCTDASCGSSNFKCHDGLYCISSGLVCDMGKVPHCLDGSDEIGCPSATKFWPGLYIEVKVTL
jgi:hypothetical protein